MIKNILKKYTMIKNIIKKYINFSILRSSDAVFEVSLLYKFDGYLFTSWIIIFGYGISVDIWEVI